MAEFLKNGLIRVNISIRLESPIYNKSKVLYGLSHSKDEIRKEDYVIVVEGYLDVISLYQHGIKNIAAVSGTALTDDQVKLLSSYTKNFYLLFDSDAAAIKLPCGASRL